MKIKLFLKEVGHLLNSFQQQCFELNKNLIEHEVKEIIDLDYLENCVKIHCYGNRYEIITFTVTNRYIHYKNEFPNKTTEEQSFRIF